MNIATIRAIVSNTFRHAARIAEARAKAHDKRLEWAEGDLAHRVADDLLEASHSAMRIDLK